jgi:hypothetical protein
MWHWLIASLMSDVAASVIAAAVTAASTLPEQQQPVEPTTVC